VLEALAARTVVVASDAAPFDEYLDADSACLVDPESVADIAAGLARALTDVPLRHRLQRGGLLRARQHSWESSAAQHVQHYQALLARLSVSAGD
jgi:glycosyltransferase involved in cell wall biosynthesis